jgi:hypothetical protein
MSKHKKSCTDVNQTDQKFQLKQKESDKGEKDWID